MVLKKGDLSKEEVDKIKGGNKGSKDSDESDEDEGENQDYLPGVFLECLFLTSIFSSKKCFHKLDPIIKVVAEGRKFCLKLKNVSIWNFVGVCKVGNLKVQFFLQYFRTAPKYEIFNLALKCAFRPSNGLNSSHFAKICHC